MTTEIVVRAFRGRPESNPTGKFGDFAPYVPALTIDGRLAFLAAASDGNTTIFCGHNVGSMTRLDLCGIPLAGSACSHPDINAAGEICFFAASLEAKQGSRAALVRGQLSAEGCALSATWRAAGPLGPTMNERGLVAFRGFSSTGAAAILRTGSNVTTEVVATADEYGEFHGLPVIDGHGAVVFRATEGIFYSSGQPDDSRIATIAQRGARWRSFGRFPAQSESGTVVFVAEDASGKGYGVFTWRAGQPPQCAVDGREFASIRGALIDARQRIVFFATPPNGTLGIYRAALKACDPPTKLLAIGARLGGAHVLEFALNPVSIAGDGQLAVRVSLDDDSQAIVRISAPSPST